MVLMRKSIQFGLCLIVIEKGNDMFKWFKKFLKKYICNVLYYKKPAFGLIVATFIVGVITTVCHLNNMVTPKDMLKVADFAKVSNNGQHFITEFEAHLGDKVKSGRIYVEEWYNGNCVRSFPAVVTQDLTYMYLHMTVGSAGGSVRISTNEFNGELTTEFQVPFSRTVTNQTFTSCEEGQEIIIQADGENILYSLDYNDGRQILVRAVWSHDNYQKQATDETFPFNMKILQLDEGIELDDPARKAAYISALEQLIYQKITPQGEKWLYGTQEYAIYDIDRDDQKELIIRQDQFSMASQNVTVYDYDEKLNDLRIEYSGYPSHTFYENGVVVTMASRNPGPSWAADDFWPYLVHQYNKKQDLYEEIAYVDGWFKEPDNEIYEGKVFPYEADLDGDGMVYYIMTDDEYSSENPVDNAAYHAWREATVGSSSEIIFSYKRLPDVRPPAKG